MNIPKAFQAVTRRGRSRGAECINKYTSTGTSSQQSRSLKGEGYGAGDGNRTHAKSLGSSYSTIELHPQNEVSNDDSASLLKKHRPIKSYVLRQGRMTPAQMVGFEKGWPIFGVDYFSSFDINNIPSPRILEIGFGMGDSLFLQAKNFPHAFFIGIEVHKPGVGSLLYRCQKENVSNIKLFCHDAIEVLSNKICDHSLDKIQIFFPDPWQKKRHHKRRLIQLDFLTLCHQKLKKEGVIHIATDWENYAEFIAELFTTKLNLLYENYLEVSPTSLPWERPETKFERRGIASGHNIAEFVFQAL